MTESRRRNALLGKAAMSALSAISDLQTKHAIAETEAHALIQGMIERLMAGETVLETARCARQRMHMMQLAGRARLLEQARDEANRAAQAFEQGNTHIGIVAIKQAAELVALAGP